MKRNLKLSVLFASVLALTAEAGNPERMGQAGATQLLINPYARNAGMVGSNSGRVRGLEAQFLNIAGTAFTRKTEVLFNRTTWLQGTDIFINAFGLTQGIGETSTIGFGVVAINAGDIEITTEEQPEGGLGTYNPTFYNISFSYAKMFSNNIFGGVNVKVINEQIPNLRARGVAIDAGIQYHTGKHDQIHIGIALRNWGPKMSYQGDGMSKNVVVNSQTNSYEMSVNNRSQTFELPTLVNIGLSYDLFLTKDSAGVSRQHRLSLNGTYTSNSFSNDNGLFGLEYAWREMLMFRGGLLIERGIFSGVDRVTAFTGPAAGVTFEVPFNEKKSTVGLDYSYRFTNPFGGTHTFGIRLNL
jgi:hypothetical protein